MNDMVPQRPRAFTIANIGSLIAVLIAVINLLTIRDVWILAASFGALIVLTVFAVQTRRKLQKK